MNYSPLFQRATWLAPGMLAVTASLVFGQVPLNPFGPAAARRLELIDDRVRPIGIQREEQFLIELLLAEKRRPGQQLDISAEQFNHLVYGRQTPEAARRKVELLLRIELQAIDEACSLTDPQRHKLLLTGQGDTDRYFRRVDELRRRCLMSGMDLHTYRGTEVLKVTLNFGLFSDASLVRKTLPRMLTEEQLVRYQTMKRKQQLSNVEEAVLLVGGITRLPLTHERTQRIVQLLLEKANPPSHASPYTVHVVLFNAAKLEEPLRRLLDDSEWNELQRWNERFQGIVQNLNLAGLLVEDDLIAQLPPDSNRD